MGWENWVKNKYLGKFFLRYVLVGFLVVSWVWKQEKKKIYYSLRQQKKLIFRQAVFSLGFFTLFHFILKFFWWLVTSSTNFPHKSAKINTLIKVITDSKARKVSGIIGLLVGLCILAPLVEECIFRYFVFALFGKKNYFAYFFSFFAFILAHYHWGENIPVLFIQYSVATVAFIYVYKKSNWNLLVPMVLHSLVNLLFLTITLINPSCFLI
ncbi:MAG: CPBP family intramembrane metalloprotease [Candidatus Moeniiplasma glomeromycotorum]|nr:CPBP family intramembrane metalloprotease [Candidatus Moeniiplasma glomeromycotorum]MCE8162539.1 CPBP family intramembrane metalloprotease [Candidatus Moeniiplasma glomeromycotorum]MCE8166535.1 CPBP family intramembrane metalloprotease [Candidatus Moeniiplasma glomeromycotorum]MCE8166994.1 CPBP family intramembrane metalloprotease [Candidatus Moeniiplasma glomeromycotorum]